MRKLAATLFVLAMFPGSVFAGGKAKDQAKGAANGQKQADHQFDGRKAPPAPVRATPAPKQSPVGQPVTSTKNNPGYKPQQPSPKTSPPPAPAAPAKKK